MLIEFPGWQKTLAGEREVGKCSESRCGLGRRTLFRRSGGCRRWRMDSDIREAVAPESGASLFRPRRRLIEPLSFSHFAELLQIATQYFERCGQHGAVGLDRPAPEGGAQTLSAQSGHTLAVDPEQLIARLSYSYLEQLVNLSDPLKLSPTPKPALEREPQLDPQRRRAINMTAGFQWPDFRSIILPH